MRSRNGSYARAAGLILTLAAVAMGCNADSDDSTPVSEKPSAKIPIAICDMDKVAEELGFLQDLNQILSNRQTQLNNKVRILQSQKQLELNEKIEEYGDEATEEQKKELAKMRLEANQLIRQASNQASQLMSATRSSLVQQIRTKIKAPIDKIATEKGIHIVVAKHPDFVLFTTDAANITTDVISAAREASLTKLVPESTNGDTTTGDDGPGSKETPGTTDGSDSTSPTDGAASGKQTPSTDSP